MLRTMLLLATGMCAFGIEDTETIRQSYPAAEKIEVRNVNGSIRVVGSNVNNIQIVATKKIDADNASALAQAKSEVRLDVQQLGDRLRVCVIHAFNTCQEGNDNNNGKNWRERDYEARMDLEIQVPPRIAAQLNTVNGSASLSGTTLPFDVKSVNGGVSVTNVSAAGSAHTVNGGVKLSFTSSPTASIDAKTVNGGIEATFPKNANANLRFKAMQGEVFTNFPGTAMVNEPFDQGRFGRNGRSRKDFSMRLGAGGPEHSFETVNGSIQIKEQ